MSFSPESDLNALGRDEPAAALAVMDWSVDSVPFPPPRAFNNNARLSSKLGGGKRKRPQSQPSTFSSSEASARRALLTRGSRC